MQRYLARGVLSHNRGEAAELEEVTRDEQEGVEQLFLLARVAAPGEEDEEERDDAEHREDQVHDVEGGFPELLRRG